MLRLLTVQINTIPKLRVNVRDDDVGSWQQIDDLIVGSAE